MLSRGKARRTQIERNDRSIALRLFAYINIEWLNARSGKKTKRERKRERERERERKKKMMRGKEVENRKKKRLLVKNERV